MNRRSFLTTLAGLAFAPRLLEHIKPTNDILCFYGMDLYVPHDPGITATSRKLKAKWSMDTTQDRDYMRLMGYDIPYENN